jgi:predicted O-methyltransferase YrrM
VRWAKLDLSRTTPGLTIEQASEQASPRVGAIGHALKMPELQEQLSAVRLARRQLADPGRERTGAGDDVARISLPEADGDTLRDLLVAERARTVVEIGLAYGSSALAIEEALVSQGGPDLKHVIIDAYQDRFKNAGWEALNAAALEDHCILLVERSQLALPRLAGEGFVADAAFVDGSHVFHNVFVDLYFLWEIVHPGGVVVLDDCQWPSVETAVRYFELNAGWQPQPIAGPTRLRAFRLPNPRVEPVFQAFTSFAA